jgi:nucleoside-diphosphate-sugar epimerase
MNYLIELVQKQTKSTIAVNKENPNPLDSEITMADQSYLNSILGEQKFTPLEDGVERLVSWAKDKEIKQHLRVWIENTK